MKHYVPRGPKGVVTVLLFAGFFLAGCQSTGSNVDTSPVRDGDREPRPEYTASSDAIPCVDFILQASQETPYSLEVGAELQLNILSTNVCNEALTLVYSDHPEEIQLYVLDSVGDVVWHHPKRKPDVDPTDVENRIILQPGASQVWPHRNQGGPVSDPFIELNPGVFTGHDLYGEELDAGEYSVVGQLYMAFESTNERGEVVHQTDYRTVDTEPVRLTLK